MTAVATPINLSNPNGAGWSTINGYKSEKNGSMSQTESASILSSSLRQATQRVGSSISLSSQASNGSIDSDISDATLRMGATDLGSADDSASRKNPTRGIWPPGKSEATAVLSTARPQSISSPASGPSAASAISALHTPILSPQQALSPQTTANGTIRNGGQPPDPTVILYLLPMNNTFDRKTINIPILPNTVRVGRQTNMKTAPTPTNAFFDSKVLSRQHAELFADRAGHVWIKDVKSSNGTFVNGKRLSPENQESEPHELHEQDIVELGIDIVSEDQKVVVHHKVAARVEHAGIYTHSRDHPFQEHDAGLLNRKGFNQQMKRNGLGPGPGQALKNGLNTNTATFGARDEAQQQQQLQQQQQQQQQMLSRMFLQPISTEMIVRRLNHELRMAKEQSRDITKIRHSLEVKSHATNQAPAEEAQSASPNLSDSQAQRPRPNGITFSPEILSGFAQHHVTQNLVQPTSPLRQPALSRSYTVKPNEPMSPTTAVSGDRGEMILLSRELDAAKVRIPSLEDRIKALEQELEVERNARTRAEASANLPTKEATSDSVTKHVDGGLEVHDKSHAQTANALQEQLDRMNMIVDDMKMSMEKYRQRAETAERERDQVQTSLAEMVEENRARQRQSPEEPSPRLPASTKATKKAKNGEKLRTKQDSTAADAQDTDSVLTLSEILSEAGIGSDHQKLSSEQAVALQGILHRNMVRGGDGSWQGLSHHGLPQVCAVTTILLGLTLMHYLNGWEKVQRVCSDGLLGTRELSVAAINHAQVTVGWIWGLVSMILYTIAEDINLGEQIYSV